MIRKMHNGVICGKMGPKNCTKVNNQIHTHKVPISNTKSNRRNVVSKTRALVCADVHDTVLHYINPPNTRRQAHLLLKIEHCLRSSSTRVDGIQKHVCNTCNTRRRKCGMKSGAVFITVLIHQSLTWIGGSCGPRTLGFEMLSKKLSSFMLQYRCPKCTDEYFYH